VEAAEPLLEVLPIRRIDRAEPVGEGAGDAQAILRIEPVMRVAQPQSSPISSHAIEISRESASGDRPARRPHGQQQRMALLVLGLPFSGHGTERLVVC
jgi:hypothetical protein